MVARPEKAPVEPDGVKIIVRRERMWALCVGLTCSLSVSVRAEVNVEGNPAAVRITTSQAAVSDVLLSFPASFKFKYRSAIPLDDPVQEAYSGSFRQVISRLLARIIQPIDPLVAQAGVLA
jgi:hypothetical protein